MKKYFMQLLALVMLLIITTAAHTQAPGTEKFKEIKLGEYQKITRPEISFEKYLDIQTEMYNARLVAGNKTLAYRLGPSLHTPCGNGDLEAGLLSTEWYGAGGTAVLADGSIDYSLMTATGLNGGAINLTASHQTLVSAGTDPNTFVNASIPGISTVAPGGSTKAVRIGNQINGNGAEYLSKSFVVTASKPLISFWYALVLQDPQHPANLQPAFTVRVLDNNNNPIPNLVNLGNGSDKAVADGNNPFFQKAAANDVVFRDWSCAQINLTNLVGQEVTIQFVTQDCALGAHFGYAYIDNFCGDCNSPYNPGGTISFNDSLTSSCAQGSICFNYRVPRATNITGSIQIDLKLYQNGNLITTLQSPVLTSGSTYCFTIDPATIPAINNTLNGFDYIGIGNFSINNIPLAPYIIGAFPDGKFSGQNNDYTFVCPKQCCPGKNLVLNGGFDWGNYATQFPRPGTQYTYQPAIGPASILPGQFGIMNAAQAQTVSPTWNTDCPQYGNHLIVNGNTGKTGKRLIWYQGGITINKGVEYTFCADFKNLDQCGFNVLPKISINFQGAPAATNINNTVINIPAGSGCAWQTIRQKIFIAGTGTYLTSISILLDELGQGDGNDVALDNISLVEMQKVPASQLAFNVVFNNMTATNYGITATPVSVLPAGCGYSWEVKEVNAAYATVANTTVSYSPVIAVGGPFDFPGYIGTNILSGVIPSPPGVFKTGKRYMITYSRVCDCFTQGKFAVIIYPDPQFAGGGAVLNFSKIENYTDATILTNDLLKRNLIGKQLVGEKAKDVLTDKTFKMSPNPTNGKVTLTMPALKEDAAIVVYNSELQELQNLKVQEKTSFFTFSMEKYPPATYFIQLRNAAGKILFKDKLIRQ